MQVTPIILCGGSGTRLWPLSRRSFPKQFARLAGAESLFQAAARRLSGQGTDVRFAPPVVLTHADFRFVVTEQLAEVGIDPGPVLIEPAARNTAAPVLAAALMLMRTEPDALMLVAPADHMIPDAVGFLAAVARGAPGAVDGQLVTFGITPDRPETGYGYLELAASADASGGAVALAGFVEKPGPERAAAMLASGRHLWNAGIFLFTARAIVAAFEAQAPGLVAPVTAALDAAVPDLGFLRLAAEPWAEAEDISLDHAVMERAGNLAAVPLAAGWSDLGGWDAVWRAAGPDDDGVVTGGPATALDCRDTLLRSESEALEIVGIGLRNVVAVAMPDAVLVADLSQAQKVGAAVEALKAKGARQAESSLRDFRPWGWFERLAIGPRFQVKRIVVHPGAALSLQSHVHRAEHWVVVEGAARVTVDGSVSLVAENQSIYVPLGAVHRVENPGKVPMVLIEVQTGCYLGEDDVVRYEDRYSRT